MILNPARLINEMDLDNWWWWYPSWRLSLYPTFLPESRNCHCCLPTSVRGHGLHSSVQHAKNEPAPSFTSNKLFFLKCGTLLIWQAFWGYLSKTWAYNAKLFIGWICSFGPLHVGVQVVAKMSDRNPWSIENYGRIEGMSSKNLKKGVTDTSNVSLHEYAMGVIHMEFMEFSQESQRFILIGGGDTNNQCTSYGPWYFFFRACNPNVCTRLSVRMVTILDTIRRKKNCSTCSSCPTVLPTTKKEIASKTPFL